LTRVKRFVSPFDTFQKINWHEPDTKRNEPFWNVSTWHVPFPTIITWNSNCHSSPSCFGHLNRIQMFPWHCHIRRLVHQAGHPIHSENNVYYKKCDAQQGMHACLYIWPTVPIARIGALPKLYRVGVGWENWYKVLEFGRANDRTNVTFLTL